MEKRETVCFTGHRANKLCGYDINKYTDFVDQLVIALEDYTLDHNITNFITGGAQGFDQLAYWAVNILSEIAKQYNIDIGVQATEETNEFTQTIAVNKVGKIMIDDTIER